MDFVMMKPWHAILILTLCFLCFLAGRYTKGTEVEISKTDTFIHRDTIRDSIPYPVYETVIQTVPELFPVYITLDGDTVREPIFVSVPVTQKEYRTDDYHIWVSGYNPSLDSIDIYKKTISITKRQPAVAGELVLLPVMGLVGMAFLRMLGVGGVYRIW